MTTFSGVPNSITFGADDSAPTFIVGDVGGQVVTIKGESGKVISIQIGNKLCGGTGGTSQPPTGGIGTLPPDGTFSLLDIRGVKSGPITYIKLLIDGLVVEGGTAKAGDVDLNFSNGLKVKFGSITYNSSQINQIQFLIVS